MPYAAVLLDLDGTLVDSNDAHARAWADVCGEAGYAVTFADVRPLIGMGGDELLKTLLALDKGDPTSKRLRDRRKVVFRERYLGEVRPYRAARNLVERMRAEGFRLVVATSASDDDLKALLRVAEIGDLIDGATTADDAESSKPAPDIIHAAVELASVPASSCVLLGDTPYDIAAARRAGVDTIALRCGGWHGDPLAGAIAIYDDPAQLLACWEDSPLMRRP